MPLPLKVALRRLARSPGFCLVAVLMLALGVAASTLTFSIADSALLRPLPFPEPGRLLRVFATSTEDAFMPLAAGDAIEIREQLGEVGRFALVVNQRFNVSEPGEIPEQKSGLAVSADFLDVLGIQPALGRGFLPTEDANNLTNVTLITDSYWREHFAGDPHVLGKLLRIETGTYTIIGVLPPTFDAMRLWRGLAFVHTSSAWRGWRANHTSRWINLVCRLNPGITPTQANFRVVAFGAQLAREYPDAVGTNGLRLTPLATSYVRTQSTYWLLVGLAALVLLIACANLGVVQLARAIARRGELAIRSALGARRSDLVLVLAVESVLIALVGAVAGVLAVYAGRGVITHWLGGFAADFGIDFRVVAYALLLTLLAGVAFGLLPAWLASGDNVNDTLKASSNATTGGKTQRRVKSMLIVGQVALALVLVSTAFSFVVGVRSFLSRDRGWQPSGLVSGLIRVPYKWVLDEQKQPTLADRLRATLATIPGVQHVSVTTGGPLYGGLTDNKVFIEGAAPVAPGQEPRATVTGVDLAFFEILRIPLREGQLLRSVYRRTDPPIAVVSASFARHFWPTRSAVGQRVRFDGPGQPWREIVGIVPDISLAIGYDRADTMQQAYIPSEETGGPWRSFVLRTWLPATSLEPTLRRAIAGIDPDIMVTDVGGVTQLLEDSATNPSLTVFLTSFAVAGLLIALIGLYGMMSQIVNERRREIGVRLALGADPRRIVRMIMAGGAWLVGGGMVAGLAASPFAAALLLRGMPQLPIPGWPQRVGLALVLTVIGAIACYLPSRRASRVDPVEILRAE